MDLAARLYELTRNLYWTWHPRVVEIFRDLDPLLWREVNHNPAELLARMDRKTLEAKAAQLALDARVSQAFHEMQEYLESNDTWGSWHGGPLRAHPVAYFSAEFGLHESLPIYSGGLGVLAGDHLKAASDLAVPLIGVGLFYAKGYFHQRLDRNGWQSEEYFASDVEKLPIDRATGADGKPLRVQVQTESGPIWVGVWSARVGRNRLVLLDTNVEGNSDDCRQLTAQLYGGDQQVRIRQELVLGVGGMRALAAMGVWPGVVHMNEGHSAFSVLELGRMLMERDGKSFREVTETAAAMTVFTTHTPVEAGHDRFDPPLLEHTLGPLRRQIGLSGHDLLALGRVDPNSEGEPFCMTVLGLRMSQSRNAVSARHGRISRAMWQGLWPNLPVESVPIGHITNGIDPGSWLAVPMSPLYNRYLGHGWPEQMYDPKTWSTVEKIDAFEFWENQQILKTNLVNYVRRCVEEQARRRGEPTPADGDDKAGLDPNALTICFARRFATYKRGDLLLRDMDRLDRLMNNPGRPVQIICAGKAHPKDDAGKRLIQRVFQATRDGRFAGKLVFLEDHDMSVGRHLVQGADVWLNTPRRPLEACGTSGQKVILNGGLNLSVLDGWWAEAYDGANGFAIGCGAEHADVQRQDQIDMDALFDVLTNQVVPLYYDRDAHGVPWRWIAMQKRAIRTLAWRFSARRMVLDYAMRCYLPAAGAIGCSFPLTLWLWPRR
jgi:glycogen phosphorylase